MSAFSSEIFFKTARSGGSGGQNVNKVETMAEVWWQVAASRLYNEEDKARIADKLRNRMNKDGYLLVKSSETRSQLENKQRALKKLEELVAQALLRPKARKPSKPSRGSIEKRLETKRKDGVRKQLRKADWD